MRIARTMCKCGKPIDPKMTFVHEYGKVELCKKCHDRLHDSIGELFQEAIDEWEK